MTINYAAWNTSIIIGQKELLQPSALHCFIQQENDNSIDIFILYIVQSLNDSLWRKWAELRWWRGRWGNKRRHRPTMVQMNQHQNLKYESLIPVSNSKAIKLLHAYVNSPSSWSSSWNFRGPLLAASPRTTTSPCWPASASSSWGLFSLESAP